MRRWMDGYFKSFLLTIQFLTLLGTDWFPEQLQAHIQTYSIGQSKVIIHTLVFAADKLKKTSGIISSLKWVTHFQLKKLFTNTHTLTDRHSQVFLEQANRVTNRHSIFITQTGISYFLSLTQAHKHSHIILYFRHAGRQTDRQTGRQATIVSSDFRINFKSIYFLVYNHLFAAAYFDCLKSRLLFQF